MLKQKPIDDPEPNDPSPDSIAKMRALAAAVAMLLLVCALPIIGMLICEAVRPRVPSVEPIIVSLILFGMLILFCAITLIAVAGGAGDESPPTCRHRQPLRPPVPPPPPRPSAVRKESSGSE